MKLDFRRVESLPCLAWCARLDRGSSTVIVTHGPGVETGRDFLVEGAWPGSFAKADFDRSHALMGSGAKLVGDALVVSTPCHTLERLHVVRHAESLWISNSLPFVLASAGLGLDPSYSRYKNDLWSIMHGLQRCVRQLASVAGPPVQLYYFTNLEVTPDLVVHEHAKPAPEAYANFADYRRFLSDTLAALASNAASAERHTRSELLATLSSGYDSPAAAALAAEVGCRRAVSFRTGIEKATSAATEDNGAPIARLLGLEVREFARQDRRAASECVAAEFAAAGDSFDLQLAAFEPVLPQSLFVTGFNGDNIWDRCCRHVSPFFVRMDPSGTSLAEFRLRLGFIHCPLPFVGGVHHAAIHAISNSAEMAPWTLGATYDRPIPRRILEEKGIPRGLFGRSKTASIMAVQAMRQPESGSAAFEQFFASHDAARTPLRRASDEALYLIRRIRSRLTSLSNRLRLAHLLPRLTLLDVPIPGPPSLVVPWGVSTLQQRYRAATGPDRTARTCQNQSPNR